MPAEVLAERIRAFSLAKRKMELNQLTLGGRQFQLLDDCHNATLVSFKNALGHIRRVEKPDGRLVFVVGRIVHIEGQEQKIYRELAQRIASCAPCAVILFDEGMTLLGKALTERKVRVLIARNPDDVFTLVDTIVDEGSLVFLKGIPPRNPYPRGIFVVARKR